MGTTSISDALTTAGSILNAGWDFISSNPILFGIVGLSLLTLAIAKVKKLFRK